jgi:peptide/nickel transport system permease protein
VLTRPHPRDTAQETFAFDDDVRGAPGVDVDAGGAGRRRPLRAIAISYLVTVFVLVTLNFLLPRALPGDPILSLIDPAAPTRVPIEELRQELEAFYGLDRPLLVQYVDYLGDLARGDLGVSIRYNRPVAELIGERLPWTLLLIVAAMGFATIVGWVAGVHSAWRRGRPVDMGLLTVFLTLRSFPTFFLGSIALFVLGVQLDLFPLAGARSTSELMGPLARAVDIAHHLALPALIMALPFVGGHYHLMRASIVTELGADYLVAGRAKGLGERRLKYGYAARNALLPVVTLTALHLSAAVTTEAIVVETVFGYPGLGRLLVDAVPFRDYPTLQASFLILAFVVVTANLLADLLYAALDPRTRR